MNLLYRPYTWLLRNILSNSSLQDAEKAHKILPPRLRSLGLLPDSCTVTDFYFENDIVENTVMLAGLGGSVRGNLFYLLDELNTSQAFDDYTIYVRTLEHTHDYVQRVIAERNWHRTIPVEDTVEYDRLLTSVKYVLTEVNMPTSWAKKPEQVYINLWHGTPLKHMGCDKNARTDHTMGVKQRDFSWADYLIYPSHYMRDHMLSAYRIGPLVQGSAVMLGYPRTGGLLRALQEGETALRVELAPNGESVFAYMPTWKDYLKPDKVVEECDMFLRFADDHLRDDQILYVNLHHKLDDSIDYSSFRHVKKFPDRCDLYQYLAATDALVTDYSSILFDYLATEKHIVLFCPDYERYRKKRGLYLDFDELPFDIAHTPQETIKALNRGKTIDDEPAQQEFCSFDSAGNAALLSTLLTDAPSSSLAVERLGDGCTPSLMLFVENGADTAHAPLLEGLLATHCENDYHLYLGCDRQLVEKNRKTAYPLLFDFSVMGVNTEPHWGSLGRRVRRLVEAGHLPFNIAIRYLAQEYWLAAQRAWGTSPFAAIVAADIVNPDTLLALALSGCPFALLFGEPLKKAILEEDRFLKDAVGHALSNSTIVLVPDTDMRTFVHRTFGEDIPVNIASDAAAYEEVLKALTCKNESVAQRP